MAATAAGVEPWVEAGPAANGKLFYTDIYRHRRNKERQTNACLNGLSRIPTAKIWIHQSISV